MPASDWPPPRPTAALNFGPNTVLTTKSTTYDLRTEEGARAYVATLEPAAVVALEHAIRHRIAADETTFSGRGRFVAQGTGIVTNCANASLRLVAEGETLHLRYDVGDLRVSDLLDVESPTVSFSEFMTIDGSVPAALAFMRRHGRFAVEYTVEGTGFGSADRKLTAHGCSLANASAELVEAENGTRLRYTLTAERGIDGDLLAFLRGGE